MDFCATFGFFVWIRNNNNKKKLHISFYCVVFHREKNAGKLDATGSRIFQLIALKANKCGIWR